MVDCTGSELQVGGREHSNVVEFVTIEYSVTAVEVKEVDGRLQINKEILPGACTQASGGCELEDMTLVIDARTVNRCRYTEVKRASFQRFQYSGKKLLVSDEHKILLEEGEEDSLPTDCLGKGVVRKTNFPRLFVYNGEAGRKTEPHMQGGEIDLEWETRVADFYMEYWALSLTREGRAERQGELCELGTYRLTEERVVLYRDHLLRMKGEIVHEFKCEWVVVKARAGYKAEGERCMDHLPVFTAQQEVSYLAPITRMLTPRGAVSTLNCSANFPLTIEDKRGRMIAANLAVTLVEVTLSEHCNQDEGRRSHAEWFDVKSLLYTAEEEAEYEQMLLGPGGCTAAARQPLLQINGRMCPISGYPRLQGAAGTDCPTLRAYLPDGGNKPRKGSCGGEPCGAAASALPPWGRS